jgi:predicted DNA-binding transcriptional regulator AlpA
MSSAVQPAHHQQPIALLRLPEVLRRYPVSKSKWYAGIKTGEYPAPVSIGPRAKAWRSTDVDALVASAK